MSGFFKKSDGSSETEKKVDDVRADDDDKLLGGYDPNEEDKVTQVPKPNSEGSKSKPHNRRKGLFDRWWFGINTDPADAATNQSTERKSRNTPSLQELTAKNSGNANVSTRQDSDTRNPGAANESSRQELTATNSGNANESSRQDSNTRNPGAANESSRQELTATNSGNANESSRQDSNTRNPGAANISSRQELTATNSGIKNASSGQDSDKNSGVKVKSSMFHEAWELLLLCRVYYRGSALGTVTTFGDTANYKQVFVRDFIPSGLAFLMNNDHEIVRSFLFSSILCLGRKGVDQFKLGKGVMPSSLRISHSLVDKVDELLPHFGEHSIASVDSGFWWIILLRAYVTCTKNLRFQNCPEIQGGMNLIVTECLADGFDSSPGLLCADGCSMMDRRMGIDGYPIEIQALFYFALRCVQDMLVESEGELIERIELRIAALRQHVRKHYWFNGTQTNNDSNPDWVSDFTTGKGGYFIGNISHNTKDFRWFLVGNCVAILSSLASVEQAEAIMQLIEEQWQNLIGLMPLKIAYPAITTEGAINLDEKNKQWEYHNGASWPVLLWLLTAASIKTGKHQIAERAIAQVEQRLSKDLWPEYYEGETECDVGRNAKRFKTWSITGYLVAKMLIENPSLINIISLEEKEDPDSLKGKTREEKGKGKLEKDKNRSPPAQKGKLKGIHIRN